MRVLPFASLKSHRAESGMLLLEVMLAVMVFSLAAVALALALNESLDAFADIRRESEVRLQLQSALAETTGQKLSVGKEKLQLGDGTVVYSRDVTLLDWTNEDKEPVSNLYQVKIFADWQVGDRADATGGDAICLPALGEKLSRVSR